MEHVITVIGETFPHSCLFSPSVTPADYEPPGFKVKPFFLIFPFLLFYYLLIIIDKQRYYVKLFYHCCNFCHVSYAAISQWFLLFSGGASKYQSWRCVNGKKKLRPLFFFIWKFPPRSLTKLWRCGGFLFLCQFLRFWWL